MAVFWDVAPCSMVDIDRSFRGAHRPDDGGSKLLWNVGLPTTLQGEKSQKTTIFNKQARLLQVWLYVLSKTSV
jgi:hypothetical protein